MMMSYAKLRNKNIYKSDEISSLVDLQTYLCVQFIISFAKIDNFLKTLKLCFIHLLKRYVSYLFFLLFVQKFKRVL